MTAKRTTAEQRRKQMQKMNARRAVYLRMLKLISVAVQISAFYFVWVPFYAAKMKDVYLWRGNLAVSAVYGLILILFVRIYRGFEVGAQDRLELSIAHALSQFITNVLFYGLSFFLCERLVSPLPLLCLQFGEMLFAFLWTLWANDVYWQNTQRERLLVFYRGSDDLLRLSHLDSFLRCFTVTREFPDVQYNPSLLTEDVDAVLVVGVSANIRNDILKDCLSAGLSVYVLPKIGDILLRGANVTLQSGEILLRTTPTTPAPEYLVLKRAFDILSSILALVLTSPIFLFTALAIKCEDGGPVFYRQTRLTKDREEFSILKFRSMHTDAEKDGKARLALENDDRITRVGRKIRACRIDELPQLVNILRGEMSIVGPRPERPEIAAQYENDLPTFSLRLQAKAGLTGYAQIYGRYNSEPYEKLQMDLMYLNNMSFAEDLKLMFATVRILFSKESTKGITDGQTTAKQDVNADTEAATRK